MVTLDLDASIDKITAKADKVKEDLAGIAKGYEEIGEASNEAINGAVVNQDKFAKSAKGAAEELKKQQTTLEKLQQQLKQLQQNQKATNDPAEVKRYNTEIAKTQSLISKVNKEFKTSDEAAKELGKDIKKAFKLDINDALAQQDELAERINNVRQAQADYNGVLNAEQAEAYKNEIAGLRVEFDKLGATTGVTADKSKKLKQGFEGAEGGSKSLNKSLLGLLKNPIVLLIAAITAGLAALFNAFQRSNTGAETMIKVNSVLEASMSQLTKVSSDLAGGLVEAFNNPKKALTDFSNSVFKAVTNPRAALKSLVQGVKETTKEIQAQAAIFEDLALRQRAHRFETVELTKTIEELNTAYQISQALSNDNTASFAEQEQAAKRARVANDARLKAELKLAESALAIIGEEVAIRKANNENIIELLEQQNTAYQKVSAVQRDITLSRIANEQQLSQIQQDRLERDLDILIDGFDNQKSINEQLINDESLTLEARKRIFSETVKLSDDSFSKQIETIQAAASATINANDLINESDAVVLNKKIRSFELSEILEGRLLEIVRDRKSALQDLSSVELVLNEKTKEGAALQVEAKQDGIEKELALEEIRYKDLLQKLEIFGLDSTEAVVQHELNKASIRAKFAEQRANEAGLEGEERILFLFSQTKAEIDAIEAALRAGNAGQLEAEQINQLRLLRSQANTQHLKDLEGFQSEERKKAKQHEINLLEQKRGDFSSQEKFEEFKQEEILKIRLKYAEEQLNLLAAVGKADTDIALGLQKTINEIKGDLQGISAADSSKPVTLLGLLGVDIESDEGKALEAAGRATLDILNKINEQRLANAQEAIDAAAEEIEAIESQLDAKESQLEKEKALGEDSFSNNADLIEREIAQLQEQKALEQQEQEKALKEKKRVQIEQAALDTLTQGSSLITASAQLLQSVALLPFGAGAIVGPALVGTMIAAFIASRAKVFQNIKKQKAEKGMFGMVDGKRHSEGGERFGDHIEVEAGEAFGILSRPASRKYSGIYKAFTNAANKGDSKTMAALAQHLTDNRGSSKAADVIIEKQATVMQIQAQAGSTEEARKSNALLAQIAGNTRGKKKVEYAQGRKIVTKGRSRVIKKVTQNV